MSENAEPRTDGLNDEIDRWHHVPEKVQDEFRRTLPAGSTLGDIAALWAQASIPRDYTTTPGIAVHRTAAKLVELGYFPTYPGVHATMATVNARQLVEVAGRHHRFCTARVVTIGLDGEGPHLCGAPLDDDGSCRAERGHRAVQGRHDRDLQLRYAKSALHRAVREQGRAEQPDALGELVVGLEDQIAKVIAAITLFEGKS